MTRWTELTDANARAAFAAYFAKVDRALAALPRAEADEIKRELERHALDAASEAGDAQAALAQLGDPDEFLADLVAELARHETIQPASIKAYHSLRSVWTMGEGATPGFAHCTASILSGRPVELRQRMAQGLYAVLQRHFAESLAASEVSLTLELREMQAETYVK